MSKGLSIGLSVCLALGGLFLLTQLAAQQPEPKKEPAPPAKAETPPAAPVKAKPLSEQVKKGLAYLANQQHADGGWGQGGGWRTGEQGRVEGANVADPSDLGNTCVAVLALLRSGSTAKEGEYAKNIAKGVEFILARVEKADKDSLYLTDVRNTQLQSKIGPYVDTFLAQLVMSELKGKMLDAKGEKQLLAAVEKTMGKIVKNQQADGNFMKNEAWASSLSMALCSKGLNRSAQMGFAVPQSVLVNDQKANTSGLDVAKGSFTAPPVATPTTPVTGTGDGRTTLARPLTSAPSDAGVEIYSRAGKTSGLQEAVNTLEKDKKKNEEIVKSQTAPKEQKVEAQQQLTRLTEVKAAQTAAVDGLVRRLDDKAFIQGFGSNGGEEFLSYMNISETLIVRGGKDWIAWDKGISDALGTIQDKDGAWSGHHCITGRTFCTSTALLTLMADRAPIPVVKQEEKKDEKK